jgi:ubiquinone/menaquinone biosynthesis C-methylase UbiE
MLLPDRRTDHTGDRQSWTSSETYQRVMAALGPQGTLVSSEGDAEEKVASAADPLRKIVQSILRCCREMLPARTTTARDRDALTRDTASQRRLEREQVRAHYDVSRLARRALWHTHVQHASALAEISAHWQLLDHLYRRFSPLDQRDVILDVGCGSGEVPRLILMNQAYRSQHAPRQLDKPPRYLGLGVPFHVLDTTRSAFDSFIQDLDQSTGGTITAHPPLAANWICTDWHDHLSITDRRCTRVLSIFSLNFVDHPLTSLREMMRTLAPGGRILIACLMPDTDLSDVYRRHLFRSQQAELSEPNRTMLLYLGWLRQALREELAHAFDQDRLMHLLIQSGASHPRVSRLMGGHVLIIVAEKPPSSS